MALVVTASIGLKWVSREPDSPAAECLVRIGAELLVQDFWLNESCNVLLLKVRRKLLTPQKARQGLALLRGIVEPTPTGDLGLHDVALEIGLTVNRSTYDTLSVAFALAMGVQHVVAADGAFVKAMHAHPNPAVSEMLLPLAAWDSGHGT